MSGITKVITAVCAAIVLAVQTAFPVCAENTQAESVLSDIFSQVSQGDFYDGLEYGGADRIVYCYTELYGRDGADGYIDSIKREAEDLMTSERFVKPTDLQKCAIALSHYGECTQELINAAVYLNEGFDKQGLNAYIWGLIAAISADIAPPENAVNTKNGLVEYILSKQLADGGFALTGSVADCDITAAAVIALSLSKEDAAKAAAVRAFDTIKAIQHESGGFSSMGTENCESTAQAIIAVACMGDSEWITDSGALDALLSYRCEGGFSHLAGGQLNALATSQACSALTAYVRVGDMPSDVLPSYTEESTHESEQTDAPDNFTVETSEPDAEKVTGIGIKAIIVALCAAAGIVFITLWLCSGRKRPLLIVLAVVFLAAGAAAMLVRFSSADEYYSQSEAPDGITVTVAADCFEALSNYDKAREGIQLPQDGVVIAECSVTLPENASALDALVEAARANRVTIDYIDSWTGAYVRGIAGLYEFDFGSESGWLYYVNGESPVSAMSEYILQDGDILRMEYTCTLGR